MKKVKKKNFFLKLVTRKPPPVFRKKLLVDSRKLEKGEKSIAVSSG